MNDSQMMAAVLYGKEDLQIETVAVPKIGDGDVLVRVQAALTCGTDVKVFRRGYHARMIVPPALFGHELAGDIVAVGKDVRGFPRRPASGGGQFRALLECFYCQRGSENLCEDLLFNNGAYAEYIRIPGAHRRTQHVRNSRARQLSGRRAGGTAGLRAARPG